MNIRRFAMWSGVLMLAIGIISLIPNLSQSSATLPALKLDTSYGLFLGLFAMNIMNKAALIAFGFWGMMAARAPSLNSPITFSRTVAIVMGAAAVLGLIPQTRTFFGYWPLFGAEVVMHAAFAALGTYFGFAMAPREVARRAHSAM